MAGGIIQLAAYGVQDAYLTQNPEVTFFKMVYRRYTNFAIESVPQYFNKRANFGETVSCILGKNGDLIHKSYLCITLPSIPRFYNQTTNTFDDSVKFAWCKKIGFAIIKNISIEIGGKLIDKHYGEYLHIWDELTGNNDEGYNKMIGNIPELYNFSTSKSSYTLYIPLRFWFTRQSGSSLPIVSLQASEIKINVEFRKAKDCYIISPSHSYNIVEDVCSFKEGDIISQKIDGKISNAMFVSSDPINKIIKYLKISNNTTAFTSAQILKSSFRNPTTGVINNTLYNNAINDADSIQNSQYHIHSDKVYCTPLANKIETEIKYYNTSQFSFVKSFLLVDYIYLDVEERERFLKSNHEYIIEQVQLACEEIVTSSNVSVKLSLNHPVKELFWTCQLNYLAQNPINDIFNYTSGWNSSETLINTCNILMEGQPRFNERDSNYFSITQPYQHHLRTPSIGIHCYSFAIDPENIHQSGTCNMSKLDNVNLVLKLNTIINSSNPATLKVYALGYNILRIAYNIGGVAFIN